jgi:hypothetical protein
VVRAGVAAAGPGGVGALALGGGVEESEVFGDDEGGCLENEPTECGDPRGAHGEAAVAELGEDGGVGDGLGGVAARGSQSPLRAGRLAMSWPSNTAKGSGMGAGG